MAGHQGFVNRMKNILIKYLETLATDVKQFDRKERNGQGAKSSGEVGGRRDGRGAHLGDDDNADDESAFGAGTA